MTLAATITALQTVVDTIPNLRVYDNPPESINEFPAAMVYSESGDIQFGSAGLTRNFHTLRVDIFHSMQRLGSAIESSKAWPDAMYGVLNTAIANRTLDIVSTNGRAEITYRTGPLPYNNVLHFGVRFTIRLKEVVTD